MIYCGILWFTVFVCTFSGRKASNTGGRRALEGGFPRLVRCTKYSICGVSPSNHNLISTLLYQLVKLLFYSTAYKNLEDRSDTRQRAWEFPGWDQCVVRTGKETISLLFVAFSLSIFHRSLSLHESQKIKHHFCVFLAPLIRYMEARIMVPAPYSPLK